ncbi:MAG: glycosyltransferase family 4 protein [Halopenitus sp.]
MVAFGVGKVNGSYVGGHINNLVTVSKCLAERGHQVHIVTTPPIHGDAGGTPSSIHESITIHVETVGETTSTEVSKTGRRSALYGLRGARRLIPKIANLDDKYDFDVIHSHSGFPGVGLIPTAARPLTGKKAIHTLYCPIPASVKSRLIAFACLRSLECILGISENVSESIRTNHLNMNVHTIPPLVDTERYKPRPEYNCDNTFRVIFVGNFSESKGIDVLLKAISDLNDRERDIELLFAFDMPVERYRSESLSIKNRIRSLGLEDTVTPLGIVDDLPGKMQEADLFVAPFRDTQGPADYPLAMLEAMATGLPVIGTDVGGIPEVIEHKENGLLCSPGEVSELVNMIQLVADNPSMAASLGASAKTTVEEMNAEIVDQIMATYREVVGCT